MSTWQHAALAGACCCGMGMLGTVPVVQGWGPDPGAPAGC